MDSISPTHEALRCPQTPNNSPYNLLLPGDPRSPSIGRKFKNTLRRKLFRSSELKDEIESPSPLKLRSRKSIAGLFDALSPKSRPEKDTFERPKTTSPRKTKSDFTDPSVTQQVQRRKSLSDTFASVRVSFRKSLVGQNLPSPAAVTSMSAGERHITFADRLVGFVADFKESQLLDSPRSSSSYTWNSSVPTLAPQAVSEDRPDYRTGTPDSYLQLLIDSHTSADLPVAAKSPAQATGLREYICDEIDMPSPARLGVPALSIREANLKIEKQLADPTENSGLQRLGESRDVAEIIGLITARMRENFHLRDITNEGLSTSFERNQSKVWDAIMVGGEILRKANSDTTLKSFPSDENVARLSDMKKRENTQSVKNDLPENVVPISLKTYGMPSAPPGSAHCSTENFRVEYPSVPQRTAHVETYESSEEAIDAILAYKYCELSEYGIFNPQNRTIYARLPESGQLDPKLLAKHGLEALWLPINSHLEDALHKSSYSSSDYRSATRWDEDCGSVCDDNVFLEVDSDMAQSIIGSQCSQQTGASNATLERDKILRLSSDDEFICWGDDEEISSALTWAELGKTRLVRLPRKASEGQDCANITKGDVKDHGQSSDLDVDTHTRHTQRGPHAERNDILLPRLSPTNERDHTLELPAKSTFTWASFLEGDVDGLIPYCGHSSIKYSSDEIDLSDTSIFSSIDGLDTHLSEVGTGLAEQERSSGFEITADGLSRKLDTPLDMVFPEIADCSSPKASVAPLSNVQLGGEQLCSTSTAESDDILTDVLQNLTPEGDAFWEIKDAPKQHEDWTALLIAESLRRKSAMSPGQEHSDFDKTEIAMNHFSSEDDVAPILSPMEAYSAIETAVRHFEEDNKERSQPTVLTELIIPFEDMEDAHRPSVRQPNKVGALVEILQARGTLGTGILSRGSEHFLPLTRTTSTPATDVSRLIPSLKMRGLDTNAS